MMQINQKYEQTIKFRDLFFNLLYHWRSLLIVFLAGVLVGGGYYYLSQSTKNENAAKTVAETEATLSDMNNQASAVTYLELLEGYQEYIENSILYKINPFDEWVAVKSYRVDQTEENIVTRTKTWLASYYASLWNNVTEDGLEEAFGTRELRYASELITLYDGNRAITGSNDAVEGMGSVFSLQVIGADKAAAERGMKYVSGLIENACQAEIAEVYPHELVIMGSSVVSDVDTSLISKKESFNKNITADQKALEEIQKKISPEQLNEQETEGEKSPSVVKHKISRKALIKNGLILGIAGMAVLLVIYSIAYIFKGVLRSGDDLKAGYMLPVYSEFYHSRARRPGKGLDGLIEKWEQKGKSKSEQETCRHLCALLQSNFENKCVLLTGTISAEDLESLTKGMRPWLNENKVELKTGARFSENAEAIMASGKADAVLIVEKKQQSRLSEIRKMAEALQINRANVCGCIVL